MGLLSFLVICLSWGNPGLKSIGNRAHPRGTTQNSCFQGPHPHGEPLPTNTSIEDSPTLAGRYGTVSCRVTAPFLWVLACTMFCLCPTRVESLHQSCGSPANCPDLQSQVLCRFLVFLPDSLTGKPDIGLRTFTILRKLLWYCCCLACGLSSLPPMGMWFDFLMTAPPYHLSVASLLSLGMGYHFLVGPMSSCWWSFNS